MKTALAFIFVFTVIGCSENTRQPPSQMNEVVTNKSTSCGKEETYPTGKKGHGCMGRPYGAGS